MEYTWFSLSERSLYDCSTKVAYVIFADQQTAAAVVEHAYANPVELNGRQLIIRHYTEPPHHVPEGKGEPLRCFVAQHIVFVISLCIFCSLFCFWLSVAVQLIA